MLTRCLYCIRKKEKYSAKPLFMSMVNAKKTSDVTLFLKKRKKRKKIAVTRGGRYQEKRGLYVSKLGQIFSKRLAWPMYLYVHILQLII